MAKKVIKTNPNLFKLIRTLKIKSNQEDVAIWKDVASKLEGSNRSTAEVNVSSIKCNINPNNVPENTPNNNPIKNFNTLLLKNNILIINKSIPKINGDKELKIAYGKV